MSMKFNNNKDKEFNPVVYSRISFNNTESEIDATKLGFDFWNGLLKVSISPYNPQTQRYDYDNQGAIYLSPMKARLLADEIRLFLQEPSKYNNLGVTTSKGILSISNGKNELGEIHPLLVLRGVSETGEVEFTYTYDFNRDYHYSIRNYDTESNSFDKEFHNNAEIMGVLTVLDEYIQAVTGAYAYANIDYGRFNDSRVNTKLNSICQNLGIEYTKNSGGGKKGGNRGSIFDNKPGNEGSLDDIDDLY